MIGKMSEEKANTAHPAKCMITEDDFEKKLKKYLKKQKTQIKFGCWIHGAMLIRSKVANCRALIKNEKKRWSSHYRLSKGRRIDAKNVDD